MAATAAARGGTCGAARASVRWAQRELEVLVTLEGPGGRCGRLRALCCGAEGAADGAGSAVVAFRGLGEGRADVEGVQLHAPVLLPAPGGVPGVAQPDGGIMFRLTKAAAGWWPRLLAADEAAGAAPTTVVHTRCDWDRWVPPPDDDGEGEGEGGGIVTGAL